MKILIITGGNSSERIVSLNSSINVKKELENSGHIVKEYDVKNGYDPIVNLAKSFDVLFPIIHGEEGEGGKLHKHLSKIKKPIVGTRNHIGMNKGWYKIPFKKFATKSQIPTSPWIEIKNREDIIKFGFPSVLKASHGGSSHEVVLLREEKDLDSKEAKKLLKSSFKLYVEKYIKGVEITVGVLNGKALPVIEIKPPEGQWFNYENKYTSGTKEIPFAPSVPINKQKEAQKIALKIHNNFNLGTYSRTDFIFANNIPFALEINTIPGLTSESLMPKAAKAAGINFGEFLEILIREAK